MSWSVLVEEKTCIGCGECVDVCPVSVYEMESGKSVPVSPDECIGCETCVEICPVEAITIEEV